MNASLTRFFRSNRRNERGLTLLESLLALAVGSAVAIGATVFFTRANKDVEAQQTADGLNQLMAGIKDRYGALGSYAGIDNAGVIANTLVPKTFKVSGDNITTPYGGAVFVTSAISDTAFTVVVEDIPTSGCSVLASRLDSVASGMGVASATPAAADLAASAPAVIKVLGSKIDPQRTMAQCASAERVNMRAIAQ